MAEERISIQLRVESQTGQKNGYSFQMDDKVVKGISTNEILKIKEINARINTIVEIKNIVVAKVNGKLVDLGLAINEDAVIELITFDTNEGRETFWHSSAHVLGQALQNLYGCKLVNGPPIEDGFYYDVDSPHPISTDDFPKIEKEMKRIVKENSRFERVFKTKEELLEMYGNNKYKEYFINKHVKDGSTIYMNDGFYDLCLGPHIYSTGSIKAVKLLKTSSVYFLNNSANESLQRVYGITFPSNSQLKEYLERLERASEMDHRKIGREMELFFFHKYSPGSCFWLPDGAHIYNKLMEFLREEYRRRGFREVITPNVFSTELWKESGHYENYRDNIYMLEAEDFALKPMNCPGHCLIFKQGERSFRDLPLRLADFGVLHRNEISGALTGLTRVRRFQQDDAHIFCTSGQMKDEIASCLDFLNYVYGIFGFTYELRLSTRPEKYLGTLEEWNAAEEALRDAITANKMKYVLNAGDGAFYGPKIDIVLCDALGRKVQCATIQLDFQLPSRFKLKYTGSDGLAHSPIIIHRAILGSIERMIGILLESFGKKLPFWLTPRQIALIPFFADDFAAEILSLLQPFELKVYGDQNASLSKRVRSAELDGYRLICVIGPKETEQRRVSVRVGNRTISLGLDEFLFAVNKLVNEKCEVEKTEDLQKMCQEEQVDLSVLSFKK